MYVCILVWTRHKTVAEFCERVAKWNKKCAYRSQASNTISSTLSTKLLSTIWNTTLIKQFESCRPGARVKISSCSSWIRRNVVLE